jgi:arylsulfatase A-like enzyme
MKQITESIHKRMLLWSVLLACGAAAAIAEERPPNIIFIVTDQQSARMMSAAGNPWLKTPALDSLAANGTRFERAYCVNPVCQPSRTGMFTGHTPARFGIQDNGDKKTRIPAAIHAQGIGHNFRKAGYDAIYCGKLHIVGGAENLGFTMLDSGSGDEGTAAASAAFLKQPRDKPFLLVSSFVNPHDICYYRKRSKPGEDPAGALIEKANVAAASKRPEGVSEEEFFAKHCPPLPANFGPQQNALDAVKVEKSRWSNEVWREYLWIYHRLTELVDRDIGRVLQAMRDAGLEENTVVIFTSDHGDMAGAHGLRNKMRFFEESAGVPFLVSHKGVTKPGHVNRDHLVSAGLDLIPTMYDFAGIKPPAGLLGRSVRSLAEGREVSEWRSYVVSETKGGRMVCSGRYKYCVYEKGETREQLVDLEKDPGEMKNLAADPAHADILAIHRKYLREWVETNHDKIAAAYVIK